MDTANQITSPYTAIVAGHSTGLAGCIKYHCVYKAHCLRADPKLLTTIDPRTCSAMRCNYYISSNIKKMVLDLKG